MVKRTVSFTAMADGGVTPAIPVFGGVKGEHHATELAVTLANGVYTAGDVVRLSFTTGDGTVLSSDRIEDITNTDNGGVCVTYSLPQLLTVAAGQLCARVVLSRMDNDKECNTWRSGEMVLYFEHADVENGTPFWTGVSEMLVRTVAAKDAAVEAMRVTDELSMAVADIGQDASNAANKAHQSATAAKESEAKAADAAKQAQYAHDRLVNTLEYKGVVSAKADLAVRPQNVGHVWYVQNDQCFYLYDGEVWRPLATGTAGGGITPHIGANGNWWIGEEDTGVKAQGDKGDPGPQGVRGMKGDPYTLTETDKAAIVTEVLTALGGVPMFGYVNDDNTIIVSGHLTSGEYVVKYEMEDGTVVDIGALTLTDDEPDTPDESDEPEQPDTPTVKNYFDASTASLNTRLGSSGTTSAYNGMVTTDFIPWEDAMSSKGFVVTGATQMLNSEYSYCSRTVYYNADKTKVAEFNDTGNPDDFIPTTYGSYTGGGFVRIALTLKDNVALTADDVAALTITLE